MKSLSNYSQKLAKNVLNRVITQLINWIQSSFPLCNGFSNCLESDLLPFVCDNLFEVL